MSSLILKQKHWRYTILSAIFILPVIATLVAVAAVVISNVPVARSFLSFVLAQHTYALIAIWLLLPLLAWYLARQAYEYGTIDRWRPVNQFTRRTVVVWLLLVLASTLVVAL